MRLIDADALIQHLKKDPLFELVEQYGLTSVIEAQPAVVRCKDCKYCDGGIDEDGKPFLKCLSGRSYGGTNADDYCSWAERREDAKID